MRTLWLPNLKRFVTGTTNGSKRCMDVNVANAVATAASSFAYKERRVHLPATTTIPGSGSAMIELDVLSGVSGDADIANDISEIGLNWNGDGIVEIGAGANAAAAASNIIATVGAGQTKSFGTSLTAGDKVWVRSVKAATITDGELVVIFLG
jgi:hypothetical protein